MMCLCLCLCVCVCVCVCVYTGMKDLDQWICITMLIAVEREIKLPKAASVWEVKQVRSHTHTHTHTVAKL